MNTLEWYLAGAKPTVLELDYVNWQSFSVIFTSSISGDILVDFGDGIIQNVPNNTLFNYTMAVSLTSKVRIFEANRLTRISFNSTTPVYRTNWNFSLSKLLIAQNLTNVFFRSGNVFGDIANLSRSLEQFSVLTPATGNIIGSVFNAPPTLKNIIATSELTEFYWNIADIGISLPNLVNMTIGGISKITGDLANLPPNINVVELRKFIFGSFLHEVSYTAGRVWANDMNRVVVWAKTGEGLNSIELDNILYDLSLSTWGGFSPVIDLRFGHGNRTTASDSYVASLQAQGVNVLLNPTI